MSVALTLCLGLVGWAMELAHPAFFAAEPLVVWTEEVSPPTLFFCGNPWPVEWRAEKEGPRTRWETPLAQAPLGVWIICAEGACAAVLRVPNEKSVVEISGAPPGSTVSLDAQETRIIGESGKTFFIAEPGQQKLLFAYECGRFEELLTLTASQHLVVKIGELRELLLSSSEVLPGARISAQLKVRSAIPLPYLATQVLLPNGWQVESQEELLLPIPPEHEVRRSFVIQVPADTAIGRYEIAVRWHGLELKAKVDVVDALSPRVVVGHWDTQNNALNLTTPFALTYERMLWASCLLGQVIPYTTELMTPELLKALLEEWASVGVR
ncbi:MAG: NEW3 domain-containing protein [Candidatus Bipolaricaulota bacterium]|nr:NEW3 domain-containing protein [Candidatus Bipolaricaulota bacterium]MDW8126585.1 NEW3 domain-containing protein [Candidatus Bipolaricaulota bacterium]